MKRKLFARWWYVRSERAYEDKRSGITPLYMKLANVEPTTRFFVENAERYTSRIDLRAAKKRLRIFRPADTNIRAVRVTVWHKVRR